MAVDFLTKEQKEQYGKFIGEPNEIQITKYFHIDESDLSLILSRRGNHNRLGFALQLTSVRFLGTFVSDLAISIPVNVHIFIAKQLLISDLDVLKDYAYRETTKREHTAIIRKHYGYHDFSESPWTYRLSRFYILDDGLVMKDQTYYLIGRVRRFLLKLLDDFNFDKALSGDNVVKALNYLKSVEPTRKQFLENPPLEIISKPWQRIVVTCMMKPNK